MKKLFRALCIFFAAAVMLMSGAAVSAESEYKLYDYGQLLSDEEAASLETQLSQIASEYDQDVIVYTTDTLDGYEVEEYSEMLESKLDAGINGSGIIYLVAMDERRYDIYAFGQMREEIMIEYMRDELAEELQPYLTDGEYYTAFVSYADKVSAEIANVYENGPNTSPSYAVPIGIVCGLIIALVTILIMRSRMNTLKANPVADEYLRDGSFSLDRERDIFLYSSISKTRRSDDDGGDSGHSSGSF